MLIRKRSGLGAVVVGSLAIGLIVVGGIVFFEQVLYWMRERSWETVTLRSVFFDQRGNSSIPLISRWLVRSGTEVRAVVGQILEAIPLWIFLVVTGSYIAVRAGRARRS